MPYLPLALALALLHQAAPAAPPPMPRLKHYVLAAPIVHAGKPACVIVVPEGEEWRALGQRIQTRIRELSGVIVPLDTGAHLTKTATTQPNMILLGYFDINPAVQPLYHQHYVFTDARYPGPNGYELRTVHDPNGRGRCHVCLGSSGLDGARMAVDAFLPMLKGREDIEIPNTVEIVVNGAKAKRITPEQIQATVASINGASFQRAGAVIMRAGRAYHFTGDPGQALVFARGARLWAKTFAGMKRIGDCRGAIEITLLWDLVEECAALTDNDRADVSRIFWNYAHKLPGAYKPVEIRNTPYGNDWESRNNWYGSQYWHKYYGLDAAGLYSRSRNKFATQEKFWKPAEDCPGYGSGTIYDLVTYALSAQDFDYFASGKAKTMGDYGMVVTTNLGYISPFGDDGHLHYNYRWPTLLPVVAWYYRDGRYQWFMQHVMRPAPPADPTLTFNHYMTDIKPKRPVDILGVYVFPLEDWIYDYRDKVLTTAPNSANAFLDADPAPSRGKCFDKISFRRDFDPDHEYLLLGGISHGYHAHPDGNAVIAFTCRGKNFLFDAGYFVPDTIEHNTLAIYRDGLFEPVPRLTSLEARADFDAVGLTQTQLAGYNAADWRRNIIWVKGRFFLFLDQVQALEPGSFGVKCIWRTIGDVTLEPDRFESRQGGVRFCLINANEMAMKVTDTTPRTPDRHAIVQSLARDLAKREAVTIANLFYATRYAEGVSYDLVRAADNAALVKLDNDFAFAATGRVQLDDGPSADAAVLYATADTAFVAGGTSLDWAGEILRADKPVNAHIDLAKGRATVEALEDCTVSLPGKPYVALAKGTHDMTFAATPAHARAQRRQALAELWQKSIARHQAALAKAQITSQSKGIETLWSITNQTQQTVRAYRAEDGKKQVNLARDGVAKSWTPGSQGCGPAFATDGNRESYSAVPSGRVNATELPKDFGIEWAAPVTISQVWIEHYDKTYRPALDGQDLQYWDGKQWVSIDDRISGADTRLWVHTFDPVTTTRVRIFITKFNTMRTAIREFAVFAKPCKQGEETLSVPTKPSDLKLCDIDADGRAEAIVAAGDALQVFGPDGAKRWERKLPKAAHRLDAADLDRDGRAEVVCSCMDNKLYCFDAAGAQRWAIDCPKDKWRPTMTPVPGYFNVVRCVDLDGDGYGEIVAGSSNWFAYAFDRNGNKLWGSLNWAHPPLDIATIDLDGSGKVASLIGTRYCAANLFAYDGKRIGHVSVGYHGCATACAAGDMDGNGKPELVAGSRVGSVECREWKSDKRWSLFMGAEVTRVLMADLVGDAKPELVVASRNGYVLVADAGGKILWKANAGDSVLDLAAADFNRDGKTEVAAACENGAVVVYGHDGRELAHTKLAGAVLRLSAADVDGDRVPDLGAAAGDGTVVVVKVK